MWKHPHLTPSAFGLALVCFLLPWIELRCDSPRGGPFSGQGIDTVRTTQSGMQMLYGGTSTTINQQSPSAEQQKQLNRQKGNRKLAAPAMWPYLIALLGGLAASLAIKRPGLRFRVVSAACGVAIVVLIVQLAIGFPIVEGVPRRQNGNGWAYTIWFWIELAATLATLVSAVVQRLADPNRKDEASGPPRQPRSAEERARLRRRIVKGVGASVAILVLLGIVLFIWLGFLRPLPSAGIAMSGYTEYMLSDEHVAQLKPGMTLEEVRDVLDISQANIQRPQYITNNEFWNNDRQKTGDGNLGIFKRSLEFVAPYKEFWFNFSGTYRTISVRIKDGKVVQIKDSNDELP